MAEGLAPGELQKMLDELRAWNERNAVQLGDGIRRLEPHQGLKVLPLDTLWFVDVWDDEYFDTIVLLGPDTPDDLIKEIFLRAKEEKNRG